MAQNVCNLSNLPAAFARYTFAPASPPPTGESCFVCLRPFGESDSVNEPPCRALLLASCDHLIGSECSQSFISTDATKQCPFCRTPIQADISAIPLWLVYLSALPWFVNRDRMTRPFIESRIIIPTPYINYLYAQLLTRNLTWREACDLWKCHTLAGLRTHAEDAVCACLLVATCWFLALPWDDSYPELWLIAPPFVDTGWKWWCVAWHGIAWMVLVHIARRHVRDEQDGPRRRVLFNRYERAITVLYIRSSTVLLGYTGVVAVAAVSWVMYCAVGALLIAQCVANLR
jgi:hypothetical protein